MAGRVRAGVAMSGPYFADDLVTLYLGDCREVTEWLAADVLVTDPPYGRGWKQGRTHKSQGWADDSHPGIAGDQDTATRDEALAMWGDRIAIMFGDLMLAPPAGTKQVGVFRKSLLMGTKGTFAGFRRDAEAFYLVGPWPAGLGGQSSVLASMAQGNQVQRNYGHPHAKPVDVMETLIAACPDGTITDPFAGSGSTLVAARNLGRRAIGVEVDERYAEAAARRLSQASLFAGAVS
jgi:site-specific DNA-methyltransferase (adenine-specific)